MPVKLYEGDVSKLVLAKYRTQNLTLGKCMATMEVTDNKLIDILKKDPLLQQEMISASNDAVQKAMTEVVDKVKAFDREIGLDFGKTGDMEKLRKERERFSNHFKDWTFNLSKEADTAGKKVWDEYKKNRSELKAYKWKTVGKVGLCVIGVATGVGVAATAAAGNVAGIVAGAYTAAKSLSKAAQTIRAATQSAEKVYTEVYQDIKDLVEEYNNLSKMKTTGKEIAVAAIEIFTTKGLNSIKKCETGVATFKTKLKGVEMEAHKAAGELNVLLDAGEQVDEEIKKSKVAAFAAKTKTELKTMEEAVTKGIDDVAELLEKVRVGKAGAKVLEGQIAVLKKNMHGKVYKGAVIVLNAVSIGATVWAGMGGGDSIDALVKGAEGKIDKIENAVEVLKGAADKLEDLVTG